MVAIDASNSTSNVSRIILRIGIFGVDLDLCLDLALLTLVCLTHHPHPSCRDTYQYNPQDIFGLDLAFLSCRDTSQYSRRGIDLVGLISCKDKSRYNPRDIFPVGLASSCRDTCPSNHLGRGRGLGHVLFLLLVLLVRNMVGLVGLGQALLHRLLLTVLLLPSEAGYVDLDLDLELGSLELE